MKSVFVVIALIFLSACQTGPGVYSDKHTGRKIIKSSSKMLDSSLLVTAFGEAAYLDQDGYVVAVSYMAPAWAHFREAWSFGKKYDYKRVRANVIGCDVGGCMIQEDGYIKIPERDFYRFSKKGFEFKLVGSSRSFESKIPARLFIEVLQIKK